MTLSSSSLPPFDLFEPMCGPGGIGTGFSKYFNIAYAIDIEKNAVRTYQANHPETRVQQRDIRDISGCHHDFDGIIGMIGGSPCQGWSLRNNRQNPNDPRNDLPGEYMRLVEEIKPEFFFFENIPRIPEEIQKDLAKRGEALGYNVSAHRINAVEYGAPQTRCRWVMVGLQHGFWSPAYMTPVSQYKTVRMAFSGITPKNNWGFMKSRPDTLEKLSRATTSWTSLDPDSNYHGTIIKLLWDQPSPTVCNVKKIYMAHPSENRNITSAEAAALQGFPAGYKFFGDQHGIGQMISDAVPVELSSEIARSIAGVIVG